MSPATATLASPVEIRDAAQRHVDDIASPDDVALLQAHRQQWIEALEFLYERAQQSLDRVERTVTGPERGLVLADFRDELDRIAAVVTDLTGHPPGGAPQPPADDPGDDGGGEAAGADSAEAGREAPRPRSFSQPGTPRLQLSASDGQIVAWTGGEDAPAGTPDDVIERLGAAGVSVRGWQPRDAVKLPDGAAAGSVAAPAHDCLGWLVSLSAPAADDGAGGGSGPEADAGTEAVEDPLGKSVYWFGAAARLAVRLVARGRMVPQLQRTEKPDNQRGKRSAFGVHWEAALIDSEEFAQLARSMPGTVAVLEAQRTPESIVQQVVGAFVDAICRDAARRVEVPAPPPDPQNASEVAENVLARLDGAAFLAPTQFGTEVGRGLHTWARDIRGANRLTLVVQLDAPDAGDAWYLRTLATGGRRREEPVEAAMSRANHQRKEGIKHELERLEELYEPLQRGKSRRRGEVVLSQEEAWELMASAGSTLTAAGFEVRVPPLSRKKATPQLRVTATGGEDSAVGAQQLTSVQWSAVFDDVELTAEDIRRLAGESRPLVKSHGRWVEVDHVDLQAAADALAERADRNRLTGAEMLRYALGLDGTALGSPVSLAGEGWAADLLRSARDIPEHPPTSPDGFSGELRAYQADALAWLEFLDGAGLGGCLALDMGLGKTPTVLAHLQHTEGPALVIAPPAVVGNWASEARRFTPGLDVMVHHGADRVDEQDIADQVASADVLLTTYGTAVRDIDALADVSWGKVVLDEAQVIKNPASETAQQLRRLDARTRLVLTGTPIENGLGDLWALLDFLNPGLVGARAPFIAQLSNAKEDGSSAEHALRTLNGVLVFRRTKAEPVIAAELPDRIDELDHCPMTPEQIGLYQAVLDQLVAETSGEEGTGVKKKGAVLAAITALKQICNHPVNYADDGGPLEGRSGKLGRLEEIVDNVFESGERMLIFTHFASWGVKLADHLTRRTGVPVSCYHGGLTRTARDEMVRQFQEGEGAGALVLSLKAGGTGLNLTAAGHVVLYDRWWNPAVEDQARDRVWRIGQTKTVVCHRLVCPGTVDERVEEIVAGKRRIADIVLPKSSSVGDLDSDQLRQALGIDHAALLADSDGGEPALQETAA